jgi:hypothetical protein
MSCAMLWLLSSVAFAATACGGSFTATRKHKTLSVFGRTGEPIHRYTMRQAIEERFILDVLKSYTTYAAYYNLLKACGDDPNVERKQAARALARFLRLHPHNIAQKTEVMVEHFQAVRRHKIGGRAKAIVVTGSRLEAVRYKQSFDEYIKKKGYAIKTLVAFSGVVEDDKLPGGRVYRSPDERRNPRKGAAGEVRDAGIPSAAGGREVPDRGSTSRCRTRCMWISGSQVSRRCRHSHDSTALIH